MENKMFCYQCLGNSQLHWLYFNRRLWQKSPGCGSSGSFGVCDKGVL